MSRILVNACHYFATPCFGRFCFFCGIWLGRENWSLTLLVFQWKEVRMVALKSPASHPWQICVQPILALCQQPVPLCTLREGSTEAGLLARPAPWLWSLLWSHHPRTSQHTVTQLHRNVPDTWKENVFKWAWNTNLWVHKYTAEVSTSRKEFGILDSCMSVCWLMNMYRKDQIHTAWVWPRFSALCSLLPKTSLRKWGGSPTVY